MGHELYNGGERSILNWWFLARAEQVARSVRLCWGDQISNISIVHAEQRVLGRTALASDICNEESKAHLCFRKVLSGYRCSPSPDGPTIGTDTRLS